MANSAFSLLKELKLKKSASAMGSGSFLPPQPLPNSVRAKQIEEQEMQAQQAEQGAGAGNEQMMQMQKAQEDAVNQLQQTQQQLAQVQADMQSMQMQTQQQLQQTQMDAQQQISKAQMDAQYELQAEKIKNQQKLLSMQEKYTKSLNKESPNQSPILANQLKRVVKKVNRLKMASAAPVTTAPVTPAPKDQNIVMPQQNNMIMDSEKKRWGANYNNMPHSNVEPSKRTQEQWNQISEWKKQQNANDPKMKEVANKVMSQPDKLSSRGYLDEVGDYWKDPKSYMQANNPGLHNSMLWNMTGGFATNVNSGFSNLARGNIGQGLMDLGSGYAQGVGTIGMGAGLLGGAARLGGKLLPSAAGRLGGLSSLSYSSAVPKALQGWKANTALIAASALPSFFGSEESTDSQQTPESNLTGNMQDTLGNLGGFGGGYPGGYGGGYAPQQQWDSGMSPAERFRSLNSQQDQYNYFNKSSSTADKVKKENTNLYSPIPILQSTGYMRPQLFRDDPLNPSKQQGYGKIGDVIKNILFNYAIPMFTGFRPMQPDMAALHGSLSNPQPYIRRMSPEYSYTTF